MSADRLEAHILAVINAARFAVWRRDMRTAEILFTRAQILMRQIPGAQ
jgi:hypothetical protein